MRLSSKSGPDRQQRAVVPGSRDGLGPFYRDIIAVDPLETWDIASAAFRLATLARTLPVPRQRRQACPEQYCNNDV